MIFSIKNIGITVLLFVAAFLEVNAVTCTSTGSTNWEAAGTWSCGRVPIAGDTIVIASGDSVTISTNIDLTGGSPNVVYVQSGAVLHFVGGGSKLTLECGSEVYVDGRWSTSGSGGGSSQTLKICGSTYWRKSDGNINGPQVFPAGLPVKLVSFSGTLLENKEVQLDWVTQTEVNNSRFELQKSDNGVQFTTFKTIAGAGNSSTVITYQENDPEPIQPVSYYRLKQVDFNGAFSFSDIVAINVAAFDLGTVWPNPAKGTVEFLLNTDHGGTATVLVQSIDGRTALRQEYFYTKGVNREQIDISTMAAGSYFIILKDNVSNAHTYKQLKVK